MKRTVRGAAIASVSLALTGCWRFAGDGGTWSDRTQDRFSDLLHDASPFPAVGWPSAVDSPYERAMASIALYASGNPSAATGDAAPDAFDDAWDDAAGGFVQEAIPSVYVSEVVWRALTHDGRAPYRGAGSEERLVLLAAESFDVGRRLDVWELLTAARMLAAIAENGTQEAARAEASAALADFDTTQICASRGATDSTEVAARVALMDLLGRSCSSYALSRAEVDREVAAALGGGVDPSALDVVSAASVLAGAGLADRALVEDGVDAMLTLARDDALEPDPRYALEIVDLASRSGRRVIFGDRMLQMLRATIWADGAIPDDAHPDALSLLAVADTFALLPGGPDRHDLAERVEWSSTSWHPHDRLVVSVAVAPERVSADDVHPLAGAATDFVSAPLMLRATRAIGACPAQVRDYAEHHLDLLRGAELHLLLRDAAPPHLRDLAAVLAIAALCVVDDDGFASSLRVAIDEHLDGFTAREGLYGIHRSEPDLEVTATVIEARCILDGKASVPPESLRRLVAARENAGGGIDAATGGVGLGATLAAAQSLAFAGGGCEALLDP